MSYDENRISDLIDGGLEKQKEEIDCFDKGLDRYLNEGIDYTTTPLSKMNIDDAKQFASDSYHTGWWDAKRFFEK